MNKNKILILSLGAILCVAGTAGALAQYTAEKETTNNLMVDTVDIELQEFQLDDNGSEVEFINPSQQLPGTTISKIPRIYNKGSACWIRVKLDFSIDDENLETVDIDDLNGFQTDNWTLGDDGYYYFHQSLSENTDIDIFDSVTIPSEWGNEYIDKNIFLDITAEAIQTKNFTPDFSTGTPWGNIEAEECVRSRDFERGENKS